MRARVWFEVPAGGRLDLASARAALYGWLYARHAGGSFELRLAGERDSPAFVSVAADLRALGLDWDGEVDGDVTAVTHVFGGAPAPCEASTLYVPLPPVEGPEAGVAIQEWIDRGYSGLALANGLARLGWSPRGKRALLSLDELAARFELGRVSHHRPAVFDRQELDWFNRRWLCGLDAEAVTALLVPFWQAAYGRAARAEGTALTAEMWQQTLALAIRQELVLPAQCVERARFAFVDELAWDPASQDALSQPYAAPILSAFARELPAVDALKFDPLDAFCRDLRLRFRDKLGVRSRDVMYVLRAALAGRQDGPCLVVIGQLLGPARCVQRAQEAIRTTKAQRREG